MGEESRIRAVTSAAGMLCWDTIADCYGGPNGCIEADKTCVQNQTTLVMQTPIYTDLYIYILCVCVCVCECVCVSVCVCVCVCTHTHVLIPVLMSAGLFDGIGGRVKHDEQ